MYTLRDRSVIVVGVAMAALGCAHADIESTPLGPAGKAILESAPLGPSASGAGTDAFAFAGYLQTLVALGVVLALAVLGAGLMKRFARTRGGLVGGMGPGGPSPSGVLEILGRYPLGSGQSLVLLRFDRRVVLMHQSGGRKNPAMHTISEVTDAEEVASIMMKTRAPADEAANSSFREAIRKMERGFGDSGFGEVVSGGRSPQGSGGVPGKREPSAHGHQVDLLVGGSSDGDARTIRGVLKNWVGA